MLNAPFIVFNPFGSMELRCLNHQQIHAVTDYFTQLGYQVVLIGTDAQRATIQHEKLIHFSSHNLLDLIPLMQQAALVVSVDTAIVHMAAAFQIKTIAFYIDMPRLFVPDTPEKQEHIKQLQQVRPDLAIFITNWINHQYCAPLNPNAVKILFHVNNNIREIAPEQLISGTIQGLQYLHFYYSTGSLHRFMA